MAKGATATGTEIREYVYIFIKLCEPSLTSLLGFYQDKTLISVSTSYEAIRLSTAAKYLGLDEKSAEQEDPNVIANFTKCGWTWDPEAKLLYPKPIVVSPTGNQSSDSIREAMKMLGTSAC
jgi:COP9 signalosome complex subunit 8